jgi:hypothetical protein
MPRSDVTPETEASALASVYSFILRQHQVRKKAAGTNGGNDDVRKDQNAHTTTPSIR